MSSAELMGWNVKQKRWFKKHEGRVIAVGCPTLRKLYPALFQGPTKEGSRAAANQWWRDQLVRLALDAAVDRRPHADYWQAELAQHKARRQWYVSQRDQQGQDDEQKQIETVEAILGKPSLPDPLEAYNTTAATIPGSYVSTAVEASLWADRLNRSNKPSQQHSIAALVAAFLKHRETDCRPDRVYNLSVHLGHFVGWADNDDIRKVNGLALINFRAFILKKVGKDRANNVMSTVKRFMRWCFEVEAIDAPPRNLESRDLTVHVPPRAVKPWTRDEVGLLLSNVKLTGSPDRHRLWYLLTLNCGIQATEISLLCNQEPGAHDDEYYSSPRLDWAAGTITRKRSKTSGYENVPTVCYRLWPETLALLKKLGSKEGIVLRGTSGQPLVNGQAKTVKTGKCWVKRLDTIGSEFRRLRLRIKEKTGKTLPQIKTLRHTAASELDESPEFARYSVHFLGHSPRGVSAKHYIAPSREQFDRAIDWLRSRFENVIA